MPGRSINYNLLLDMPQANGAASGRFQQRDDPDTNILDNSRTFVALSNNVWSIVNANGREDRVALGPGDNLCVAVGEKVPAGAAQQVRRIRLNATVSFRPSAGRTLPPGSPFGPAANPRAAFSGVFPADGDMPLLVRVTVQGVLDGDGNRYDTYWYLLDLGRVRGNAQGQYELAIGAEVTTTAGTQLTFSHDPEVDVGTDPTGEEISREAAAASA